LSLVHVGTNFNSIEKTTQDSKIKEMTTTELELLSEEEFLKIESTLNYDVAMDELNRRIFEKWIKPSLGEDE